MRRLKEKLPWIIALAAAIASVFLALALATPMDGFAASEGTDWLDDVIRKVEREADKARADVEKARIKIRQVEGIQERARAEGNTPAVEMSVKVLADAREFESRSREREEKARRDLQTLKSLKAGGAGKCEVLAGEITKYEQGMRHIDSVMAGNRKFIEEAEEDGSKAKEELVKTSVEATAETLSMGMKSFVQTQKSLQDMKDALNKLQAGKGGNYGVMSYDQIVQAQKWMDRGLTHGQNVIDVTKMSIEYYKKTSLRGNAAFEASPYAEKLKTALTDFNEKFMYDAGGWEFVGEQLASVGGGAAGEIAFKAAMAGIKATAAGIGMKISKDQLAVYRRNQEIMAGQRTRTERKLSGLQTSLVEQCLSADYFRRTVPLPP